MRQKSYDGSPTLYLIPTPIGNRDDITLRALDTLKKVEVLFCEDTRETGLLLKYFDIKKKLISNHEHNEENNKNKIIQYLKDGHDVGLVSDRGTPVISDPGYFLARHVISEGFNVVSLPGATALIPALTMSGLNPMPFAFIGFLNNKEGKRKNELEKLKDLNMTMIFYESPHRIEKMLQNVLEVLGDCNVAIAREISKKFEEVIRGKVSEVLTEFDVLKGEIVVIVEPILSVKNYDNISLKDHVELLINNGLTSKEAIKKVALLRGKTKSEVYSEYHIEK